MVVTRSSSKETDRFVTAFSTGSESLSSRLVFERVGGRQGSERFAQLPAEQRRRLRNDVGDFPVRSRALWIQSPDHHALDVLATPGPLRDRQAFCLEPGPAPGLHRFRFHVLCHCFRFLAFTVPTHPI